MNKASASKPLPASGSSARRRCARFVPDPKLFKNGRHFAAWIGLTPRLDGTGGKTQLGRISKAGDRYSAPAVCAGCHLALAARLANKTTPLALWVQALLARRSKRAVTVALANKLARVAWAIMAEGEAYRPHSRQRSSAMPGGASHERPGHPQSWRRARGPSTPRSAPRAAAALRLVLTAAARSALPES